VVITGGSQGLGLAMVDALAARGASVIAISRDRANLVAAAQAGAAVIAGDATDTVLMNAVVREEAPDVLILNAGARLPIKPIDQLNWDEFSIVWNTDVKAGLVGIQPALDTPMKPGSRVLRAEGRYRLRSTRTCPVPEGIKDRHREMHKIPFVPGRDGEAMHSCCGSDHSVLRKNRVSVDQSCIFAKTGSVHGEDLSGSFQIPGPHLDLIGLRGILPAGDLDTLLDLPERDRGEEALAYFEVFEPGQCASVRLPLAHLGDHVGIDEIASQFTLLEYRRLTRFHSPALGKGEIEAGTLSEENILPGEAPLVAEFLPLFERDHDRGIDASPCDNLRPFLERILDQFAKARFRVL